MVARRTVIILSSIAASAAFLYCCRRWLASSSLSHHKPQRNFKIVLADNSTQPFVHLQRLQDTGTTEVHPFHDEISILLQCSSSPPKLTSTEAGPPPMTASYTWIETKAQLVKLAEVLSHESEFAVDTEQHSVRSFLGFTALVQVSTRKQDFLIDAIALHDEMGILRNVFADSSIRKVFHGADSDILWLQRDFHIYIANLFDTAKACDVLGKPQRSLAYLLQNYCGIVTNKTFQRADWRLRPLPVEMIEYAQMDAHYLLYISDCLQNELVQGRSDDGTQHYLNDVNIDGTGSPYGECVRRSNLMCLQLYEKDGPSSSPGTVASSLFSRYHGHLNPHRSNPDYKSKEDESFWKILYALCEWRDAVARVEDESPRFVLSDRAILALAERVPSSHNSLLCTISNADEAVPVSDVTQYKTPLPSPSPVLLQNVRYLQSVLKHLPSESKNSSLDCMVSHLDTFRKMKEISSRLWDLCSSSKDVMSWRNVEGHEEVKGGQIDRGVECRIPRQWKSGNFEASRRRLVKKFSCKAPVYHNCRIYAGDGRLLCYCDRKKLDWYVQRGLAEFTDEDPPAIKLLFEPKGRPEDENNEFYIQSKSNRCVGCGESSHYLRYRVIPSCYRQHFPEHLKSHRSHDIVLLCVDCHEVAHCAAERHKKQVAIDYGVPLFARRVMDSGTLGGYGKEAEVVVGAKGGVSPLQLRTAAMALLRHGPSMPKERREELEAVVRDYYGGRNISLEDIQAALLVGKGPRELRRFLKKRGLVLANFVRAEEEAPNGDEDTKNLACKNSSEANLESRNNMKHSHGQNIPLASLASSDLMRDVARLEMVDIDEGDVVTGAEFEDENKHEFQSSSSDIEESLKVDVIAESHTIYAASEKYECDSPVDEVVAVDSLNGNNTTDEGSILTEFCSTNGQNSTTRHISSQGDSERSLLYDKPSQRVSLLGHGPHGKKVVEILLDQEGEDGIVRFCQRWRAVFVESVKPDYLPSGWDISHSGRREFGDYSVYNPLRKAVKQSA